MELELCKKCGKFFIPQKENIYKLLKDNNIEFYCSKFCYIKAGGSDGERR